MVTAGFIVLDPAALLLVLGDLAPAVVALLFGIVLVLASAWLYPGDHPVQKLVGHRHPDRTHAVGIRRSFSIAPIALATGGSLSLVIALIIDKFPIALRRR